MMDTQLLPYAFAHDFELLVRPRRADEVAGRYPPHGGCMSGIHSADNATLIRPTDFAFAGGTVYLAWHPAGDKPFDLT